MRNTSYQRIASAVAEMLETLSAQVVRRNVEPTQRRPPPLRRTARARDRGNSGMNKIDRKRVLTQ